MPCEEDALPGAVLRVLRGSEDFNDTFRENRCWECLADVRLAFEPRRWRENDLAGSAFPRTFSSPETSPFAALSSSKELEPSYLGQSAQGKILWLPADDPRREASVAGCLSLCFAKSLAGKGAVAAGIL